MFENVDTPDEKEKERKGETGRGVKCVCAREREGGREEKMEEGGRQENCRVSNLLRVGEP